MKHNIFMTLVILSVVTCGIFATMDSIVGLLGSMIVFFLISFIYMVIISREY